MIHCPTHPGRRRAFSLIEVMFAIGVLGFGLIAIAALFPVGLVQQKRAWDDANGVIVAQNVLAMVQAHVDDRGPDDFALQPIFYRFSEPPGFPAYTDPVGTYDYRLAWRRLSAEGPVELAVFVFRKPRATTPAADSNLIVSPVAAGDDDRVYRRGFSGAFDPGQIVRTGTPAPPKVPRNQVVLAQHRTNADVPAYVLSVIQEDPINLVREAPDIPAVAGEDYTDQIIYAPDKAVAIVIGVVQ